MTYKTPLIYLISLTFSSCLGIEDGIEIILERMAKVHIEHNVRFNAEYNKICEERNKKVEVEFETDIIGCFRDMVVVPNWLNCYFNDVFNDMANDWLYITYQHDLFESVGY